MMVQAINLLCMILFIRTTVVSATSSKAESNPVPEKRIIVNYKNPEDPFYLVSYGMLVFNLDHLNDPDGEQLHKNRKWLHFKSDELVKTVDIRELKELGLEKGQKFQVINWNNKEVKEYTLGQEIQLLMIKSMFYSEQAKTDFFRTFYLVLDKDFDATKVENSPGADEITGIAYSGNEFSLQPATNLTSKDYIKKTKPRGKDFYQYYFQNFDEKVKSEDIIVDYFLHDNDMYYFMQPAFRKTPNFGNRYDLSLKREHDLKHSPIILNSSKEEYGPNQYINFVKDADLSVLLYESEMHSCGELVIIKKSKAWRYQLMCDSGGC